jgi:hypothetical protein
LGNDTAGRKRYAIARQALDLRFEVGFRVACHPASPDLPASFKEILPRAAKLNASLAPFGDRTSHILRNS